MNSISAGGTAKNNRALFNTALRVIDYHGNTLDESRMTIAGLVEAQRNVQCGYAGAGIGNGLNIVMKKGDYSASLAYYTNPAMSASFYDYRPVAGKPTHWAYSGDKQGAFDRFQAVIERGEYPKTGPAASAWKAWYDPANQIKS